MIPTLLRRRPALADICLLLLAPLLLAAPEWLGTVKTDPRLLASDLAVGLRGGLFVAAPGFLDPNSAWTFQSLGHLAAEQWLSGRVPWWNPLSGVGAPLAAELQPAALFLPFVLLLHFAWGWLAFHLAMQATAGIGTWALLRRLGLSRAICLLGGVLFATSGTFAWFSHGPERAASFLPWMLHAVECCRSGRRGIAALAVAVAATLYAGWPETAYLDGLLVAVWTLARLAPGPNRTRLILYLLAGLVLGTALAAPCWWPFLLYARDADVGGHGLMAQLSLPGAGLAMLLLPYLNGPLAGMGPVMFPLWSSVGSYIGVLPVMLGFAGLAARREAVLRRALALWLVLLTLRLAGWGPAVWIAHLIPFLAATNLPRYIAASLSFGCIVLTCLTLEDWRRAGEPSRAALAAPLCAAIGAAAIAAAVWADLPIATALWAHPVYRLCFIASIAVGVAAVGLAAAALRRPPRALTAALLALVAIEPVGNYLGARLGAPRAGHLDLRPVQKLADLAGLSRVISGPGALGLNENAQDGFAAVDETMLPVPRPWADYVLARLHGDPIQFIHTDPTMAWLGRDWPALRGLGVGWLITPTGTGPANALATRSAEGTRTPVPLVPGGTLSGTLATGLRGDGPIASVGVDIGTYRGRSDGSLGLTLQGGFGIAHASAPIAGATDNAALTLMLDRSVPAGQAVRWTLSTTAAHVPVAIWLSGTPAAPRLTTAASFKDGWHPALVYSGAGKDIYRVPSAAPYWDTHCRTGPATREAITLTCATPATLLRRELFFPGWRATINAVPVPITPDGLFERIALPAGTVQVRFRYAPPGILWAYLAALIGLALTLASALTPAGSAPPKANSPPRA